MPRRKLTIDDFKFSLENTVKINTQYRMKNTALNIIPINFTQSPEKIYKQFIFHTENEEIMWEFIDKLNIVLTAIELPLIDKTKIKLKGHGHIQSTENHFDECLWYDMPEFKVNEHIYDCVNVKLEIETVDSQIYISFIKKFYDIFNIILWPSKTSLWYPTRPNDVLASIQDKMYISDLSDLVVTNKYPIYIISKGRYEKRYTSKYLEWCNIDYKIVIEPDEFLSYSKYINKDKILVLPDEYLNKNQGGIPARNFVWEHSKNGGHKRHWILDDNITCYKRFISSQKILLRGAFVFRAVEDFVDRFTNVKMAGHNYTMFGISTNTSIKPITMNTRIYSSILLSNDIYPDYKWRGKYNEDTDLSLRILKGGYSTMLFNCFLADKLKTLTQKGGNTDSVYAETDGILLKTQSLVEQHGDVAKLIQRFGRTHHHVDYTSFKDNRPLYVKGIKNKLSHTINEYGMRLIEKNTEGLYIDLPGFKNLEEVEEVEPIIIEKDNSQIIQEILNIKTQLFQIGQTCDAILNKLN